MAEFELDGSIRSWQEDLVMAEECRVIDSFGDYLFCTSSFTLFCYHVDIANGNVTAISNVPILGSNSQPIAIDINSDGTRLYCLQTLINEEADNQLVITVFDISDIDNLVRLSATTRLLTGTGVDILSTGTHLYVTYGYSTIGYGYRGLTLCYELDGNGEPGVPTVSFTQSLILRNLQIYQGHFTTSWINTDAVFVYDIATDPLAPVQVSTASQRLGSDDKAMLISDTGFIYVCDEDHGMSVYDATNVLAITDEGQIEEPVGITAVVKNDFVIGIDVGTYKFFDIAAPADPILGNVYTSIGTDNILHATMVDTYLISPTMNNPKMRVVELGSNRPGHYIVTDGIVTDEVWCDSVQMEKVFINNVLAYERSNHV